jgi:hypothetical protein
VSNKFEVSFPCEVISDRFSEYVASLAIRRAILKHEITLIISLIEPSYINELGTGHVSQSWIFTNTYDTYRCLAVFLHLNF